KYGSVIRKHSPSTRLLYCVADLHFLRLQRQAEIETDPALRADLVDRAERMRRGELDAMCVADCVIVHSPAEARLLRQISRALNVQVIPWTIEPREVPRPSVKQPALALIGGYRHPPNVDAAKWAAHEIMPLIRRQLPKAELLLVGSHMPQEVAALAAG